MLFRQHSRARRAMWRLAGSRGGHGKTARHGGARARGAGAAAWGRHIIARSGQCNSGDRGAWRAADPAGAHQPQRVCRAGVQGGRGRLGCVASRRVRSSWPGPRARRPPATGSRQLGRSWVHGRRAGRNLRGSEVGILGREGSRQGGQVLGSRPAGRGAAVRATRHVYWTGRNATKARRSWAHGRRTGRGPPGNKVCITCRQEGHKGALVLGLRAVARPMR